MQTTPAPRQLRVAGLAGLGCLLAAGLVGCGKDAGDEGKRVTVTGKVTFTDGKPLHRGVVVFVPDAAKGNQSKHEPRGFLNAEGVYTANTDDKRPGVLPGPYKIKILADEEIDEKNPYKLPAPLVHKKYTDQETSGYAVEVVENPEPGRYNYTVSK